MVNSYISAAVSAKFCEHCFWWNAASLCIKQEQSMCSEMDLKIFIWSSALLCHKNTIASNW